MATRVPGPDCGGVSALSLTIPLAMLSDWIFKAHAVPSALMVVGSLLVIGGFLLVNRQGSASTALPATTAPPSLAAIRECLQRCARPRGRAAHAVALGGVRA
jgi:hypothetical protein